MLEVTLVENEQQKQDAFAVRQRIFVDEQQVPQHLEYDEFDNYATHFVIYDKQQAIGAARLRELENSVAKIERVCIDKNYRGQHLGVTIMQAMEAYAKAHGLHHLKLNAQSYAIPFYEKLGYEVNSPEFLDAGIPHRAMQKEIVL